MPAPPYRRPDREGWVFPGMFVIVGTVLTIAIFLIGWYALF